MTRAGTYLVLGQEGIQVVVAALGLWEDGGEGVEGWEMSDFGQEGGWNDRGRDSVLTAAVPAVGFLGPMLHSTLYVEMMVR